MTPRDEAKQAAARRRNMAKARTAKQAAATRRLAEHRRNLKRYRRWVVDEAAAYRLLIAARAEHAADSRQVISARRAWSTIWRDMPKAPPDHIWKQIEELDG